MSKNSERPASAPSTLVLGTFSRAHGIRGALVLRVDPSLADAVVGGLELVADERTFVVRAATPTRGGVRVALKNVSTRDEAEALIGTEVSVDRDALPDLDDGEYYDVDVVGTAVQNEDGVPLGRVTQIIYTGANDVFVVTDGKLEVLVPKIDGVVLSMTEELIVVDKVGIVYGDPPKEDPDDDETDVPPKSTALDDKDPEAG